MIPEAVVGLAESLTEVTMTKKKKKLRGTVNKVHKANTFEWKGKSRD